MSHSSGLEAAIDWAPDSSLHMVWLNSFSVPDVVFLIEGDHLATIVVSNTFLPLLVVSSHPLGSSVIGLGDTLSVLHQTVSVNTPNVLNNTIDKFMFVGILSLCVFNLEPVSGHLDSLIVESSPLQSFHTSVVDGHVTRVNGPKTVSVCGRDLADVTEDILP